MSRFNLSALAVRERSVTLFLLVAISIAGIVAFLMLGRAEDPSFTIKQMNVITAWPGATAKQMEELVAERLEKRMQELRWYDRTETRHLVQDSAGRKGRADCFYQSEWRNLREHTRPGLNTRSRCQKTSCISSNWQPSAFGGSHWIEWFSV